MSLGASRSVVVDTSHSPHAQLRPVPLTAVTLTDTFWAPRMRVNWERTLPEQYRHLEETHRIDNFRRAAGKQPGTFKTKSVALVTGQVVGIGLFIAKVLAAREKVEVFPLLCRQPKQSVGVSGCRLRSPR